LLKVDDEDGTEGTTEISTGSVLEGPYTVTIDRQATTDFEVTEAASGEAILTISYTHSTHDFDVTGTNVVPEFPIGVIGAVVAVIGIVAIMTRTKFARGFRHQ
jgi:ribose/xylose/arabinose/galactoside ABC-type transport system permease subunit